MGIAVLLLAAIILLVRFSPLPVLKNSTIEVQLVAEIEAPAAEPEVVIEPMELIEPAEPAVPTVLADIVEVAEPQATDWYADVTTVVKDAMTTANHIDSMHAAFDEKRRFAAINFPATEILRKKPIWENVETDQMGRKILVSGDCYRVLEDWRATYHEIQQSMGQYMVYCNASDDFPMDVAWVDDVREGYAYLNNRDDVNSGIVVQ